ncbi:MAG: hypothetical protein OEZ22_07175 [Spirochaetia bacterium]|nr:hypothetical protein [Spirochaetia bacterium]
MTALLITFLFFSIILIFAALIYPFSIIAVLLQTIFLTLSIYVYRKKKENPGMTVIAMLLHSVFFIIIFSAFIFISYPSKEDSDIQSIITGLKKITAKYFNIQINNTNKYFKELNITPPDKSSNKKKIDNNLYENPIEKNIDEKKVEDPF